MIHIWNQLITNTLMNHNYVIIKTLATYNQSHIQNAKLNENTNRKLAIGFKLILPRLRIRSFNPKDRNLTWRSDGFLFLWHLYLTLLSKYHLYNQELNNNTFK